MPWHKNQSNVTYQRFVEHYSKGSLKTYEKGLTNNNFVLGLVRRAPSLKIKRHVHDTYPGRSPVWERVEQNVSRQLPQSLRVCQILRRIESYTGDVPESARQEGLSRPNASAQNLNGRSRMYPIWISLTHCRTVAVPRTHVCRKDLQINSS